MMIAFSLTSTALSLAYLVGAIVLARTARHHEEPFYLWLAAGLFLEAVAHFTGLLSLLAPSLVPLRMLVEVAAVASVVNSARLKLCAERPVEALPPPERTSDEEWVDRVVSIARNRAEPSWRNLLWDSDRVLLCATDLDGKVKRMDGGAMRHWHLKPGDATGIDLRTWGEQTAPLRFGIPAAKAGIVQVVRFTATNGRTFLACYGPTFAASGDPDGMLAVAFDVTDVEVLDADAR